MQYPNAFRTSAWVLPGVSRRRYGLLPLEQISVFTETHGKAIVRLLKREFIEFGGHVHPLAKAQVAFLDGVLVSTVR